jgi:hypothetical protein
MQSKTLMARKKKVDSQAANVLRTPAATSGGDGPATQRLTILQSERSRSATLSLLSLFVLTKAGP